MRQYRANFSHWECDMQLYLVNTNEKYTTFRNHTTTVITKNTTLVLVNIILHGIRRSKTSLK